MRRSRSVARRFATFRSATPPGRSPSASRSSPRAIRRRSSRANRSQTSARFRVLGQEIKKDLRQGEKPNPETVEKALAIVTEAETKVEQTLERNTTDRNEADKFLKALHGLLGMLETPALDILLSGVEDHPEATLGQLLGFMSGV